MDRDTSAPSTEEILHSSPVGISISRVRDGHIIDMNDEFLSILGFARDEVVGRTSHELGLWVEPGQREGIVREFLEAGRYSPRPTPLRRKDGTVVTVLFSASPLARGAEPLTIAWVMDLTETLRLEEALRVSEEKWRTLVESAPVVILTVDRAGTIRTINHSLMGRTDADLIGRCIHDFTLNEFDRRLSVEHLARVFSSGKTERFEVDAFAPDGQPVRMRNVFAPIVSGGQVTSVIGVGMDITAEAQAAKALRLSKEQLSALSSNLADCMVYQINSGRDGQLRDFSYLSPAVERFHGLDVEAVQRNPRLLYEQVVEEDRSLVAEAESRSFAKRLKLEIEVRVRLPSGEVRWRRFVSAPRLSSAGDWLWDGIEQDVTERREAERRLFESESKYRSLFESSTDGIFILDLEGRFIDANPAAYTRLGYIREELLSLDIRELDSPAFASRVPERLRQLREQGVAMFESAHRRKDGSVMPVEVNSRLLDYGGRKVYFSIIRDISERKQAEEALSEQKALLQQILDTASVAIFLVDMRGVVIHANQRMAEMFACSPGELLGGEYTQLVHPAERAAGQRKMLALLANEIPSVDLERLYLRKDGREFWGHLTGRRFHDVNGNELGLIGVISDVSARRHAEEALRASEKMLQTIIDTEPECVKLLDENANLIMMNRSGLSMLEVESLDQVRGRCVCPLVTSEYRQDFMDLVKRVFQGGAGSLQFEMLGLKGRHLWMETHAVPLRDDRGEIFALLGVTRDITDRRLAEEALKASEARFRAIIENASAGILVADVETRRFTYANPEICRMLGYSAAELLALAVPAIHPPEEQQHVAATFAAHIGLQTLCVRRDGSVFPVDIKTMELELDHRPCLVGFFTDITERRLLEEERLRAQKLESVGVLAGGIAHDFNNLLQGLFGYVSLARMSLDEKGKAATMLDQAEKALHLASNLTTQLLTFAKGGTPVKRLLALGPVIENAARLALSGSRSRCRLDIEDGLWPAEADEGQLGQVIQNIVLNADQAMPLGGTVAISARNLPASLAAAQRGLEARDYLELTISDQGVGIPEKYRDKIFDPYFTTKERGSGLGLATCYSIIRNHGGRIEVRSEIGCGSTFFVFLPASPSAAGERGSAAAPTRKRSGRALVMDDDEAVRSVAASLLRSLGFEADSAEHGEAALEKYERAMAAGRPFDVVILDLTVRGGLGGSETMRRLLALDPSVTAIVTSGYADSAILSAHREHGFKSVLKKPFLRVELERALDEAMR